MAAIELEDVTIAHDGRPVLTHVDLRVRDGEVLALLGGSGTGKTSLLRVVAGLQPVDAGRVLLDDRDVTDVPSHDRDLGMVAQGAPLQPTLDVEGNLRLPLDLRGDDRASAAERTRGQALRFRVSHLLRRGTDHLSTGERAAVATARSMIRDPAAVLLDEPATHLDRHTRAAVLQQVGIVQRTRGTTMLVATNDISVAMTLSQRVAVIDRGTVAQVGTFEQLREAPLTLDIADLVEPSPHARLTATVVGGDRGDRARIRTAAGDLTTWHRGVREVRGGLVVAVAPHDLQLAGIGDAPLSGTVRRVTTTGARRLVEVLTAGGTLTVDAEPSEPKLTNGTMIGVRATRAVVAHPDGEVIAVLRWA